LWATSQASAVAVERRLGISRTVARLWEDEAAHAEALLHLVERLLAEVAHPQEIVILELEQLADLDDVVALERVVGPHRQVQLLDRHVEHVRGQLGDTGRGAIGRGRLNANGHEGLELAHGALKLQDAINEPAADTRLRDYAKKFRGADSPGEFGRDVADLVQVWTQF
jgi:hypothetical protein